MAIVDLGDGTLQVTETGAAEDGSDLIQVLEGVEGDIRIRLDGGSDGADDAISLDLSAGSVAVQNVSLAAGDGDNVFAMLGGSIEGNLRYRGGDGIDLVAVSENVSIGGHLGARLGDGNNVVEVGGEISGHLRVRGGVDDDTVTLLAESMVGRGVGLALGAGDNTTELDGTIDGRLRYRGGDGNDSVALGSQSVIENDVRLKLGAGDNSVTVAGTIEGDFSVLSGNEEDSVVVEEEATVAGETDIRTGDQADSNQDRPRRRGRRGFRFGGGRR